MGSDTKPAKKDKVHYAIKTFTPSLVLCGDGKCQFGHNAITRCCANKELARVFLREFYKNKGEIVKCINEECPYPWEKRREEDFECYACKEGETLCESPVAETDNEEEADKTKEPTVRYAIVEKDTSSNSDVVRWCFNNKTSAWIFCRHYKFGDNVVECFNQKCPQAEEIRLNSAMFTACKERKSEAESQKGDNGKIENGKETEKVIKPSVHYAIREHITRDSGHSVEAITYCFNKKDVAEAYCKAHGPDKQIVECINQECPNPKKIRCCNITCTVCKEREIEAQKSETDNKMTDKEEMKNSGVHYAIGAFPSRRENGSLRYDFMLYCSNDKQRTTEFRNKYYPTQDVVECVNKGCQCAGMGEVRCNTHILRKSDNSKSAKSNNMSGCTNNGQEKGPKTVVFVFDPPKHLCSVEEIKEWAAKHPPLLRAFYLYDDEPFYDVIQVGDRYRDPVDGYEFYIVDINNEIIDNHSEWEDWDRDFFVDGDLLRDRPFDKDRNSEGENSQTPEKEIFISAEESEKTSLTQTDINLKFLKMETKKEKQENGIVRKMKDLYMPKRIDDARLTLNGVFCVERNGEWVGIDDDGVTTYPTMYTFPIPMLTVNKPVKDLRVGEIIAVRESYGRVTEIKNKIVKYVGFDGGNHSVNIATDFVFKVGFVRTVLAPKLDGVSGDINKNMGVMMVMTMMDNAEDDVLLPMLMMWNQNGSQMNPMAIMPMMLLMKGKEEILDNKKSDTAMAMMMAMIMGQQNGNNQSPFGNMQNPSMMLPMLMAMKDGSDDKSAMAMMAMMMGMNATQNGKEEKA